MVIFFVVVGTVPKHFAEVSKKYWNAKRKLEDQINLIFTEMVAISSCGRTAVAGARPGAVKAT